MEEDSLLDYVRHNPLTFSVYVAVTAAAAVAFYHLATYALEHLPQQKESSAVIPEVQSVVDGDSIDSMVDK